MKSKPLTTLIAIIVCSLGYAQDSSWVRIKVDENLTVTIPRKNQQLDTSFGDQNQAYDYRLFKAETQVASMVVTVTPNTTGIDVDDEESLRSVLDSFEKGSRKALSEKGLTCQSKDSLLDALPCKKIEAFWAGSKDPVVYNYCLLVNDKMYMFTISPLHLYYERTKLIEESNRFLNSIRFTKTVKEKQFATKAESTAYKFGYYLIPFLLIVGFIAYIVYRIVKS
jgi:hypothetical protein